MNKSDDNLTPEEQRLIKVVNKGIEQVVVPAMDALEKEIKQEIKSEAQKVQAKLDQMEGRLEQMDRKLDKVTEISFDNKNRLDTLESLPTIAHELKSKKSR